MKSVIILAICLLPVISAHSQDGNKKKAAKKETVEEVRHLKLYPTEADKYINIYVTYDEPTDFTITILGSERNNERKWDLKAKMTHQQSMDVTALPNGSYTITLTSDEVNEKSIFNVKR